MNYELKGNYKKSKKVAAMILAVVLCIPHYSIPVYAAEEGLLRETVNTSGDTSGDAQEIQGFSFAFKDGEALVTKYTGTEWFVDVPNEIYGVPVTEIGENAFSDNCSIGYINVPEGVKKIGVGAIIFNDLANSRVKDEIFDWDMILNFNGETGPYIQYQVKDITFMR